MSLATRCPACSTTFRVVQDQLKISGGWVRCGQCHQVFNGLEALLELPDLPAAPAPLTAPETAATAPAVEPSAPPIPAAPPPAAPPPAVPSSGEEHVQSGEPQDSRIPTGEVAAELSRWPDSQQRSIFGLVSDPQGIDLTRQQPDPDTEPSDFDPIVSVMPFTASRLAATGPDTQSAHPDAPPSNASAAPDPTTRPGRSRRRKPAFMRQAERAAQWRRPAMRWLLGSTAAALALMLGAQIVHQYRDEIAARWAPAQAPLQAWCELVRCQLQAPRALASVALDSSSLQRTPRPQVLRFEADLRNSASHAVRAPALDVSFHDLQGVTVARKVLLPEELAAPAQGIGADSVWHLSALLDVGDLPITGFAAEVFYP